MHFKLLIALVQDHKTETIMQAARKAGATGCTIIGQARGEGLDQPRSFFGLTLESQRNVLLFLVEEHLSRSILECLAEVGEFERLPGSGIAFQLDVEDAVGVSHQIRQLNDMVEDKI